MKQDKKGPAKLAFILSVATLILAAIVSIFQINSLWLAGTQWVLIAIVLGVYAIFLNGCNCGEECCKKEEEIK
ncbi:MAG: hypothetical protein V1804_02325 [Patescibacteria group bacterium]